MIFKTVWLNITNIYKYIGIRCKIQDISKSIISTTTKTNVIYESRVQQIQNQQSFTSQMCIKIVSCQLCD